MDGKKNRIGRRDRKGVTNLLVYIYEIFFLQVEYSTRKEERRS